jgi:CheY-like chemotaxis protein
MTPSALIVDDEPNIRRMVGALLGAEGFDVRDAADGAGGLARAREAEPDVILLDLMMPGMDGYEFRRRQLAERDLAGVPTLVLTAGTIDERVKEMTVEGWLRKPVHLPGLLAAIHRCCRKPRGSSGGGGRGAPGSHPPHAPAAARKPGAETHLVHFFDSDTNLAANVTRFLVDGLARSEAIMVVATRAHQIAVAARLEAAGVDLQSLQKAGMAMLLDAEATLDRFMIHGRPARGPFTDVVGGALGKLARSSGARQIRAYGEMVDLLWRRGDVAGAVQLEELWNGLSAPCPFSLLCGYHAEQESDRDRLRPVECLHGAGVLAPDPNERLTSAA